MKILVTGRAGFVGSHVAEYYAKNGEEVMELDNLESRDWTKCKKNWIGIQKLMQKKDLVSWWSGLRIYESLHSVLKKNEKRTPFKVGI